MAAAGEGAIDFVEPAVNTIYIDLIMIGIIGARWALKIATFVVVVSAMCELSCFGLCLCVFCVCFFLFLLCVCTNVCILVLLLVTNFCNCTNHFGTRTLGVIIVEMFEMSTDLIS